MKSIFLGLGEQHAAAANTATLKRRTDDKALNFLFKGAVGWKTEILQGPEKSALQEQIESLHQTVACAADEEIFICVYQSLPGKMLEGMAYLVPPGAHPEHPQELIRATELRQWISTAVTRFQDASVRLLFIFDPHAPTLTSDTEQVYKALKTQLSRITTAGVAFWFSSDLEAGSSNLAKRELFLFKQGLFSLQLEDVLRGGFRGTVPELISEVNERVREKSHHQQSPVCISEGVLKRIELDFPATADKLHTLMPVHPHIEKSVLQHLLFKVGLLVAILLHVAATVLNSHNPAEQQKLADFYEARRIARLPPPPDPNEARALEALQTMRQRLDRFSQEMGAPPPRIITELNKLKAIQQQALHAFAAEQWQPALALQPAFQQQCDALRELQDLYETARSHQKRAQQAAEQARPFCEMAQTEWAEGERAAQAAATAFEAEHLPEALQAWETSVTAYHAATQNGQFQQARTQWEQKRGPLIAPDGTPLTELELKNFGAPHWQQANALAQDALNPQTPPTQAIADFHQAHAQLQQAIEQTHAHLQPQLRILCAQAEASIVLEKQTPQADQTWQPQAPNSEGQWVLQKQQRYRLTITLPGYEAESQLLFSDWKALKKLHITLDKLIFPTVGTPWTAKLGPDIQMEFIPIAPGTFQMGSDAQDPDERPRHTVHLTHPFWMAATEVTQAQYKAITGKNPSQFKDEHHPVENVNWYDAMAFCAQWTQRDHQNGRLPKTLTYTLPTEAQWEYAARADQTDRAAHIKENNWHAGNSQFRTHPVAQLQPNAWGLFDLYGNCWEWCRDACHSGTGIETTTYQEGISDPCSTTGNERIKRGGGFNTSAKHNRPANRASALPSGANCFQGFRVCLVSLPETHD